jgi:hypothetical protein
MRPRSCRRQMPTRPFAWSARAPLATGARGPAQPPGRARCVHRQEAELRTLAQRLDAGARLLTVLGPSGTGKTRLACRYGWSWLGDWPGGVCFCDLSEARSVEGILPGAGAGSRGSPGQRGAGRTARPCHRRSRSLSRDPGQLRASGGARHDDARPVARPGRSGSLSGHQSRAAATAGRSGGGDRAAGARKRRDRALRRTRPVPRWPTSP